MNGEGMILADTHIYAASVVIVGCYLYIFLG